MYISFDKVENPLDFNDNVRLQEKVIKTLMLQPSIKKALFYDTTSSAGDWLGVVVCPNEEGYYNLYFFHSTPEGITIEEDSFDRIWDYKIEEWIIDKVDAHFEWYEYLDQLNCEEEEYDY
jgi:hypothetical protein